MTTTLPPIRAFLFDLDGTLVDSNDLHVETWDRAFRQFGKTFTRDQLRAQIGKGSDKYLPEFLTPAEIDDFGKALDHYRSALFKSEYLPRVQPFPRVRDLFQRIHDDGHPIVLATSGKKSETEHYIELLGIGDLIAGQTTADDADESKPAADIFQAALGELPEPVPAAEALVIGDTRFDMEAAREGGFPSLGVTCGGTEADILRDAGALATCRDPADLLASCDELKRKFQL